MNSYARFALLSLVALALFLPGAAEAKKIDKTFHEKFDVKKGSALRLDHGDGDVTITPWDRDEVDVKVRYHCNVTSVGIGAIVDFDVEFRRDGGDVVIRGKETSKGVAVIRTQNNREYTYVIRAPRYMELDLDGDDGDVTVNGWRENIKCSLDDGDVALADIEASSVEIDLEDGDVVIVGLTGDLEVSSDDGDVGLKNCVMEICRIDIEDGDVEMKKCEGDFHITVDDGDVELNRVKAGNLRVRGADGRVEVSLLQADDLFLDIATDDGNVVVEVEEGTSAEFAIHTDDGRVKVNLSGVKNLTKEEHSVSGTVGGGDGKIRIRTADGGVVLRDET